MKVVHVSYGDIIGGAARSAYRLHAGLRQAGVQSEMLVQRKVSADDSVRQLAPNRTLSGRVQQKLWRLRRGKFADLHRPLGDKSLEVFSVDCDLSSASVIEHLVDADVVNLHWVSGMIGYKGIARLAREKPLVWTLHDMNPFTGGCHFDGGCGRFRHECGQCPQLQSTSKSDESSDCLSRKQASLRSIDRERMTIVAPSQWLAAQARESALFSQYDTQVIPYGLDVAEFSPRDAQSIRPLLDIPKDARVILFLADAVGNRRKGGDLVVEALRLLKRTDIVVVAVGAGGRQMFSDCGLPVRCVDPIHDDRLLSLIYSAADLFCISSRADNLPNTVLEAMACGVPVVGFNVGGVPDLVVPAETGVLAKSVDAAALASAIGEALGDEQRLRRMRHNCRNLIVSKHGLEKQAEGYLRLYHSVRARVLSKV